MKVTIITVTKNSVRTIRDTLDSIACQDYADIESIVIDGGSSDATCTVVRSHPLRTALLVSACDEGIYHAMNKGLRLATGEIVGFLNADDGYASSTVVSTVVEAFTRSSVQLCYGDLVYVQRQHPERIVRYWKAGAYREGAFARGWSPPHPSFFARREVYAQHGGFDLRYRRAADFDLMLRLMQVERLRARYIPQVMVRMRAGGVTNRNLRGICQQNGEILLSLLRNRTVPSGFYIFSKAANRLRQFLLRPNCAAQRGRGSL